MLRSTRMRPRRILTHLLVSMVQVPTLKPLSVEVLWANTVPAEGSAIKFVHYTGLEARAVMNTSHPETKVGLLDLEISQLAKVRRSSAYLDVRVLMVVLVFLSVGRGRPLSSKQAIRNAHTPIRATTSHTPSVCQPRLCSLSRLDPFFALKPTARGRSTHRTKPVGRLAQGGVLTSPCSTSQYLVCSSIDPL
ncbi:hypothetical protein BC827DRAFT_1249463, partial [Russula dissimulans]